MENGYNIFWTPNALNELEETIEYLQNNFTDKEIKKLVHKLESITEIISQNPNIFPKSEGKNIHKAVILEFNTMYYRVKKKVLKSYLSFQTDNLLKRENFNSIFNNEKHYSILRIKLWFGRNI